MIVSSIYLAAIVATCIIETQLSRADAFSIASNGRQLRLSSSSSNIGYIIITTTTRSRNNQSSLSAGAVAGPKGDGRRRPSRRGMNTNVNKKSDASTRLRRASRSTQKQRSCHRNEITIPFDGARLTSTQISNVNAPLLDLQSCSSLRLRSTSMSQLKRTTVGPTIHHNHIEYLSLDDLFPNLNFSSLFHTNASFRQSIRRSMRHDIFHSTPSYAKLSEKAASCLLDDDSSLQGSWRCRPNPKSNPDHDTGGRMTQLTLVLQHHLGPNAPTGDEFLNTIGSLCGPNPSTHWIDIVGIKDRVISHSWHQDTGRRSAGPPDHQEDHEGEDGTSTSTSSYTVMLGFPCVDSYTGTGVFSHVVRLQNEHWAPEEKGHGINNEPVLLEGSVEEEYIIRPIFDLRKELVRYRDVDVIHSAPDVAYRCSVMRFM